MQYPEEVKKRAYELYLEGLSLKTISSKLSSEFPEIICKPATIKAWANNEDWNSNRALARASMFEEATEIKTRSMTDLMQSYMEAYDGIISKGTQELEYLPFESAEGASKAVHDSIQGFTKVARGMIQIKFIEDIVNVLKEEIEDEQSLKRIYIKLQKVAQEYSS